VIPRSLAYLGLVTGVTGGGFVFCSAPGCMSTSAAGEFPSMPLRLGFSYCFTHMNMEEVSDRIMGTKRHAKLSTTTVIFYDLELGRDGQVEQLAAFTEEGMFFGRVLRTSVRTNTSANLKSIPPMTYSRITVEPRDAFMDFIGWVDLSHRMNTGGDTDPNNVVLAAHFGSCHDHVHLIKAMKQWGLSPPMYRLADTVLLFKVCKGMQRKADLSTLATTYAAWMPHLHHDADSDARILRVATMIAFPDVRTACYSFSISYMQFCARTGLDQHPIMPMIVHPGAGGAKEGDTEEEEEETSDEMSMSMVTSVPGLTSFGHKSTDALI